MLQDDDSRDRGEYAGWRSSRIISFLSVAALLLPLAPLSRAVSADYPKKQITWIVPFSPGGGYDNYSRAVARYFQKYLPRRVSVVIKNVSGAGGRRGSAFLYRSKPDGYTIGMLNPVGLIAGDLVKESTQYDLAKFTYLATCGRGIAGVYVSAQSGFSTIEDMQKAEKVKFATSGRGSGTWLWGTLVKELMNVPVHMVSGYLGTSEYVAALIRKDVDAFAIGFASSLIPYCQAGEIKPILLFSREPWELMPGAATLKGTPYEGLEDFNNDRVIAGPPGMPDEIRRILENSLLTALSDPELLAWSKKTLNPLYIKNAEETRASIEESMRLAEEYRSVFQD
jgi:tripartite-type tricarboxylate transporter receptor subunit TctC